MGFTRACVQHHCFTAQVELTVSKLEPADVPPRLNFQKDLNKAPKLVIYKKKMGLVH
jgi:hypothetical protein